MKIKKSLIILSTIGILGSASILPLASCGFNPVEEPYLLKDSDVVFGIGQGSLKNQDVIIDILPSVKSTNLIFSKESLGKRIGGIQWDNPETINNRFISFELADRLAAAANPIESNYRISDEFLSISVKELIINDVILDGYDPYFQIASSVNYNILSGISNKVVFNINPEKFGTSYQGEERPPFNVDHLPKEIYVKKNTISIENWAIKLSITGHEDIIQFLP